MHITKTPESKMRGSAVVALLLLVVTALSYIGVSAHIHSVVPKSKVCHHGAVRLGDTCYFIEAWRVETRETARRICLNKNARLARVNDDMKNRRIDAYLHTLRNARSKSFWIAAMRDRNRNTFIFTDWNKYVSSAKWADGEPNDAGGTEDCVTYGIRQGTKFFWNDVPCSLLYSYICEMRECPDNCREEKGASKTATTSDNTATDRATTTVGKHEELNTTLSTTTEIPHAESKTSLFRAYVFTTMCAAVITFIQM